MSTLVWTSADLSSISTRRLAGLHTRYASPAGAMVRRELRARHGER